MLRRPRLVWNDGEVPIRDVRGGEYILLGNERELFWVQVVQTNATIQDQWFGIVSSRLSTKMLEFGDIVMFGPEHILGYANLT